MLAKNKTLLCIIGPTASGKTRLAVQVAAKIGGEIISADSRQLYRKMDIGTGKDKEEYTLGNLHIPVHLIDIVDSGYHYSVFEFQKDFQNAYNQILSRNHQAVLCGGSGMYIEAVLKNYTLCLAPENKELRDRLTSYSMKDLVDLLSSYTSLHNTTDSKDRNRLIRAIEIQDFYAKTAIKSENISTPSLIFYIHLEREILRKCISERLHNRLQNGMVDEVKDLLDSGLNPESLMYYGLEYKYLTLYLTNLLSYDDMVEKLQIAIHQFAKRQETWFRRMQRNGFEFNYIEGSLSEGEKMKLIFDKISATV